LEKCRTALASVSSKIAAESYESRGACTPNGGPAAPTTISGAKNCEKFFRRIRAQRTLPQIEKGQKTQIQAAVYDIAIVRLPG